MIALALASLLATVPLADSDDLFDPGRDGERISVEGIVRDARISESGTLVVDVCRNASKPSKFLDMWTMSRSSQLIRTPCGSSLIEIPRTRPRASSRRH